MRDLLLIICFIAVIMLGYWIVKKADLFFAENAKSDECNTHSNGNLLRIAFSNPLLADSICENLELLSKKFRNAEFIMYGGSSNEILGGLAHDDIDICFVDESTDVGISLGNEINTATAMLYENDVTTNISGLQITPFKMNKVCQKAVWKSKNNSELLEEFTINIKETNNNCFLH